MNTMRTTLLLMLCLLSFYHFAPQPAYGDARLSVAVSILPHKYFVEKIGKRFVDVNVVVPPGANPATYEPTHKQLLSLSLARIYFATGAPFEQKWLPKIRQSFPDILTTDINDGIKLKEKKVTTPIETPAAKPGRKKHTEDGKGTHYDPHTWLAPPLVIIQARNILNALVEADPSHSAEYRENYKEFTQELIRLDFELMYLFSEIKTKKIMLAAHPAWNYFADAYGITMINLDVDGKEPSKAQLSELITKARKNRVKNIFIQPQFPAATAKTIAKAIGAQTVEADALSIDWEANLRSVAKNVLEGLYR